MPSDPFSITSATNSENTPNVRATVAPPWLRVTLPERSRSGSRAPPAQTVAPTATASGDWPYPAKWSRAQEPANQAAAPERACDGPIMPVAPPRAGQVTVAERGGAFNDRHVHYGVRLLTSGRARSRARPGGRS